MLAWRFKSRSHAARRCFYAAARFDGRLDAHADTQQFRQLNVWLLHCRFDADAPVLFDIYGRLLASSILASLPGTFPCCLVCSSTVGASNFAASGFPSRGIPWEVIPEHSRVHRKRRKSVTGAAKREGLKRLALLSLVKASTIAD